jgi:hypothetical protein
MLDQLGKKWRDFWRAANQLALAMDADPRLTRRFPSG